MTTGSIGCGDAEPLLFALLEGEVDEAERAALDRHLAECAGCRAELERERELTRALESRLVTPDRVASRRSPWLVRLAAAAIVGIGIALAPAVFSERSAYGSIAPELLAPTLTLESGAVRPLASRNHLEIPARERDTIAIDGCGKLAVTGPAVLDLDRVAGDWKVVLLKGQLSAQLDEGARLFVSSLLGTRTLVGGSHVIALDPAWFAAAQDAGGGAPAAGPTPAELLQRGFAQFFQQVEMAGAEASFRAALEHASATAAEKSQALFYLGAAVGRQERFAEALELQSTWMEQNPDDPSLELVLLFHGIYLRQLGREEEAIAAWKKVVAHAEALSAAKPEGDARPDAAAKESDVVALARQYLAGVPATLAKMTPGSQTAARGAGDVYVPDRLLPAETAGPGARVVVAWGLDEKDPEDRRFREVARKAASFHSAALIDLPARDLASLEAALREKKAATVLFVLRPETLDLALHRQVLRMSRTLDEDLFPDFLFGWLTARDAEGIEKLWERTAATHRRGLSSKRWMQTFVTSGMKSCEYPDYGLDVVKAAGFERRAFAFAVRESDPDVLDYAKKSLPQLEQAGVIMITGNGDPQGIWLFDDQRNVDASRHWPFDPQRVGEDPKGEMPRVRADLFAALKLDRPVVWSGTCHSAATHRVFVEGDIVSTFGSCEGCVLYDMPLKESLGLSILEGGAVALLAPIGANHGYSVDLEGEFALTNGASLGEAVKSTWDDALMQARGEWKLAIPTAGGPPSHQVEPIMQGGGANRALLGDPTLHPFDRTPEPRERVKIEHVRDHSFDVVVEWDKGWHVRAWNLYGDTGQGAPQRIAERVDVGELLPKGQAVLISATLRVEDSKGRELEEFELTHAEPESFQGRRFLHLQASGPKVLIDERDLRARFTITWKPFKGEAPRGR